MIYNFDKFGKKVVGWKYKKQNNRIYKSPKHFKFKTKDYILVETRSKNIKLLAINGTELSYKHKTKNNIIKIGLDYSKFSEFGIRDKYIYIPYLSKVFLIK